MTKIVINRCYGGFGLSHEAIMRYAELKGIKLYCDDNSVISNYYTVPVDEFHNLHNTAKETGDYSKVNQHYYSTYSMDRDDPILIQVVEELGDRASGKFSELEIVNIPDDIQYDIEEYDGKEWVAEKHRVWP